MFGLPVRTDRATNRCPQHGSSREILSLTKPTSACSSRARVSPAAQLKLFYKAVHTAELQLLCTFKEYWFSKHDKALVLKCPHFPFTSQIHTSFSVNFSNNGGGIILKKELFFSFFERQGPDGFACSHCTIRSCKRKRDKYGRLLFCVFAFLFDVI